MLIGPSKALDVALRRAGEEVARRGDRRVGTDHLLLGLLHDADVAEALGVDVERARAVARDLDQAALAAIGVDLGDDLPSAPTRVRVGHIPLTSAARAAIGRSGAVADAERVRRIEPRHLLAALREGEEPDPAAVLFAALGVARGGSGPGRGPHSP
jgi:hypothetical protein